MNNENITMDRSDVVRDVFYQGWNVCITSNYEYLTVTISPSPEIQYRLWYQGIGYGHYPDTIRRTIENIVDRPVCVEQVINFLHTDRTSFQYSYNSPSDLSYTDCVYKNYDLDAILSSALYAVHFINTGGECLSFSALMDILHDNKDDEVAVEINKDEFFMILENRSKVQGEELLFES